MKATLMALALLVVATCDGMSQVNALIGTWQVEGKNTFESWYENDDGDLIGESYRLEDGQKKVLETLKIVTSNGITEYRATVPDQNDGRTIPFTLNTEVTDKLSFENLEHDFPKRIMYTPINEGKLFVEVQGAGGEGFSFYLIKK